MLARLALVALAMLLLAPAACVPKVKSSQVAYDYPLSQFAGPDSLPPAPGGTRHGIAMSGTWRVVDVQHSEGDPTVDHLFELGWFLRAAYSGVASVQGVRPDLLLPPTVDWQLNRVDDRGMALGFGYATPRGSLDFLHYAFVAAADDADHARAIEALHYRETNSGAVAWSIWSVQLERVGDEPAVVTPPPQPSWPR